MGFIDIVMFVFSVILVVWVMAVLVGLFLLVRPILQKDREITQMAFKAGFRKGD